MFSRTLGVTVLLGACLLPRPASGHLVILEPNGGEVYTAGEVVTIRWCIAITHELLDWDLLYHTGLPGTTPGCTNVIGGFSQIEINLAPTCTGPGGGGICFLNPDPPCCMEYEWTIPNGIDSDEVKIKIRMDNSGQDYFDLSDNPFTIMSATSTPVPGTTATFVLEQNEPNPFRPSTTISFVLENDSPLVKLAVYDTRGAIVKTLLDQARTSGRHSLVWDGTDASGAAVASGIYFYRLETARDSETRRMVLLR